MSQSPEKKRFHPSIKWIVVATLLVVMTGAYFYFGNEIGNFWRSLAEREQQLLEFQAARPALTLAAAFLVYTAVTGASLPGATLMTLMLSWFLARVYGPIGGLAVGVLLISFASTAGATIAFLISRYLFRDWLHQKYGERLAKFNEALRREGAFYLFTLRLLPAVPFFLINVVMGLTRLRVRTFWWVSQLGMLPGTTLYVWAGTTLPGLQEIVENGYRPDVTTIVAFILLGVFPLVVKKVMEKLRGPAVKKADA